jgi:hypothetical protein
MNISILQSTSSRPLFIDFEQYTDGDAEFKKELITLMIDNLKEIQDALNEAMQRNMLEIFEKTCHKIKPTLSMLEDKDFIDTIQCVKAEFSNSAKQEQQVKVFNTTCHQIIKSLEKEGK